MASASAPTADANLLDQLAGIPPGDLLDFIVSISHQERCAILDEFYSWDHWARPNQLWPEGDWTIWFFMAGRGAGKTRTGAEMTRRVASEFPGCRIGLVARSASDYRQTMIEGVAGILACSPPWDMPEYRPSKTELHWPNGSMATTFSADEPNLLRGPEFDFVWADELAAWRRLRKAFSNIMFALRGKTIDRPRMIITSTPKPLSLLKEIVNDPATVVSSGGTSQNWRNLPDSFLKEVYGRYSGTTMGDQELGGRLLAEADGALWKRATIDKHRIKPDQLPELSRVVIPIDPAVTNTEGSDETGIVPVGEAWVEHPQFGRRQHFYPLEDLSDRMDPMLWATIAVDRYDHYKACAIVGEVNNGGDLVELTIRVVEGGADVNFQKVHASTGKTARAEPISALYQQGRVHHVGGLPELEDQMCNYVPGVKGDSPDRMDSMVWGISYLLGKKEKKLPKTLGGQGALGRKSNWANWRG